MIWDIVLIGEHYQLFMWLWNSCKSMRPDERSESLFKAISEVVRLFVHNILWYFRTHHGEDEEIWQAIDFSLNRCLKCRYRLFYRPRFKWRWASFDSHIRQHEKYHQPWDASRPVKYRSSWAWSRVNMTSAEWEADRPGALDAAVWSPESEIIGRRRQARPEVDRRSFHHQLARWFLMSEAAYPEKFSAPRQMTTCEMPARMAEGCSAMHCVIPTRQKAYGRGLPQALDDMAGELAARDALIENSTSGFRLWFIRDDIGEHSIK